MESFEQFFWGSDEGYIYRRFNQLKVKYETIQSFREHAFAFLFLWMSYGFFTYFPSEGIRHFWFMTTWGLYFTAFGILLNYFAAKDQQENPGKVTGYKFTLWRTAVLIYELWLPLNILITTIYWTLLFKPAEGIRFWYLLWIHLFPLVFTLCEFRMQKWLFRAEHFIFVLGILIAYMIVNYTETKVSGKPLYPILPWDPFWKSFIVCALWGVFIAITYFSAWHITK